MHYTYSLQRCAIFTFSGLLTKNPPLMGGVRTHKQADFPNKSYTKFENSRQNRQSSAFSKFFQNFFFCKFTSAITMKVKKYAWYKTTQSFLTLIYEKIVTTLNVLGCCIIFYESRLLFVTYSQRLFQPFMISTSKQVKIEFRVLKVEHK